MSTMAKGMTTSHPTELTGMRYRVAGNVDVRCRILILRVGLREGKSLTRRPTTRFLLDQFERKPIDE
jgi:hypothetical protein